MSPFPERLLNAIESKGTPACVGLDPRVGWIPESIRAEALDGVDREGPPADAAAVTIFNRRVLDLVADLVPVVKLQIAFYEALGPEGLVAYRETARLARERGLIVIGDVKRGDIGSTAGAYAEAHLGPDAPFGVDAITVNPLFGTDGLQPFVDIAVREERGLFILARTSNPSSAELQDIVADGRPVHEHIAALIRNLGDGRAGPTGYGPVGAVVGATAPAVGRTLRQAMPESILLVPGYGAQGATADDLAPFFDAAGRGAIVNSSRGVVFAWRRSPWSDRFSEEDWEAAVRASCETMVANLKTLRS